MSVQFETLKGDEIKYGNNKFIEVARKKAISDEGEREFISISSGFFMQSGEKRYNKSFTVPLDENVIKFVAEKLREV